jgi:hypothetical protein
MAIAISTLKTVMDTGCVSGTTQSDRSSRVKRFHLVIGETPLELFDSSDTVGGEPGSEARGRLRNLFLDNRHFGICAGAAISFTNEDKLVVSIFYGEQSVKQQPWFRSSCTARSG